jgi:PLP dependent protein
MVNIAENIKHITSELPQNVKLVAVSKTKSVEEIMQAYQTGHRIFGENKVQEIIKKHELLPKDIDWHFIGHLQRNKVKQIIPFVSLIHSVDSLRLLEKINEEAKNINKIVNCLFQIHIAQEETKFGFSQEELVQLLPSSEFKELQNIRICGLMGMATYTENIDQLKKEFSLIKTLFDTLVEIYFINNKYFKELSIGMSGDYKIAVEHGSTMVRIGSHIFGERNF